MAMNPAAIREALTTAMLNSTAPMVLSDPNLPDCPMIVVNQAFANLTGYDPLDITGQNCRFLQGPKTDAGSRRRIRACLEAGTGCIEWIVNYRRDGTWTTIFPVLLGRLFYGVKPSVVVYTD
jgi:PAS domain S-box-containing protein